MTAQHWRWLLLAVLVLAGLTACNESYRVAKVFERTDTTITRRITIYTSDGKNCVVVRAPNDTTHFKPGDSLRCGWSDTP